MNASASESRASGAAVHPGGNAVGSAARSGWEAADSGVQIREYLAILLRRKGAIALVFGASLALAAAFLATVTPRYRAGALLLIERTGPHVIDIQSVDGEAVALGGSEDYYTTQYEILASRTLASDVIAELGLESPERFEGAATAPWRWLREYLPAAQSSESPSADSELAVRAYLRLLSVEPVYRSRLVHLYFEAADPQLAERIVGAHAQAYIRYGTSLRAQASSEAGSFLQDSVEELRKQVAAAQEELSEFRRKHDIVSLDDRSDVVTANLEDMNAKLIVAQAERIARESELRLIRQRSYETLPAVINSELIRRLKEELAPLEREYAAMLPAVTPSYSGVRALKARIEESRRRIDVEIGHIVEGIESDYMSALARERELTAQVQSRKKKALELKDASVEYALLKQNVDTAMRLYESVRQRSEETSMVANLPSSNVSVIDAAYAPRRPWSPRRGQVLLLSGMVGLLGGIGWALLRELLGGRYLHSVREVERYLQLPALAAVPDLAALRPGGQLSFARAALRSLGAAPARARGRARPPQEVAGALAQSERIRETYRALRTDLLLMHKSLPCHTLLFVSATGGEGKTTTALGTAALFAQLEAPALLIDADLRHPRCHELLRTARGPGLSDALAGGPCAVQSLQLLGHTLGFLPAGALPPNPVELLGSSRMHELIRKLREQFAYVLLDGGALDEGAEALTLCGQVDGVVLVADAQRAPLELLQWARRRLEFAQARLLGVVLNRAAAPHGPAGFVRYDGDRR